MKVRVGDVEFDLELAASRLSADMHDDWFPDPVYFADYLSANDALLASIGESYEPDYATEVNVPKPGFTVRYSLEQDIRDRVVYQGLVNELQHLDKKLLPAVFGYRVRAATGREMFHSRVQDWVDFNTTVRVKLQQAGGVLLAADIQNYFEAINHDQLIGDLTLLDPDRLHVLGLLKRSLRKWCRSDVGLPQNRDASSFLANLYLLPIDKHMVDKGYQYFRYMDDIRVICADKFEARRALLDLVTFLRVRYMNVNARKTVILECDDDGVDEFVPEPDGDIERFDAMTRSRRAVLVVAPMVSRLETLLQSEKLESRAFRAALHRVRRIAGSRFGSEVDLTRITRRLVESLVDYPWHSDAIAKFLRYVALPDKQRETLCAIVTDTNRYPYAWQAYHVWMLLASQQIQSASLRQQATNQSSLAAAEDAVRAAGAIIYLGACGGDEGRARLATQISQYPPHRMVRRALVLATQEVSGYAEARYLADLPAGEMQFRRYLRSRTTPIYVADAPYGSSRFASDLTDGY